MAVAEARAAWQRAANRCFVQEDAKRAPKLACCPSTSSSTKPVDVGPASGADVQDNLNSGFMPLNRNPSYTNLPPDSRWWHQLQPNYRCQTLEAEMETFRASKLSEQPEFDAAFIADSQTDPSIETRSKISAICINKDFEVRKQELKAVHSKDAQESPEVDSSEGSFELLEMDSFESAISKESNELSLDSGFPWIGGEKTEPWWRTADRDELASFVAQRSLDLIENCDLPQPQNKHVKSDPYAHVGCLDRNRIFTPSKDWKPQNFGCPNTTVHTQCNVSSGSVYGKKWASVEVHSPSGTGKPISDGTDISEMPLSGTDPSKAQLLEALRHSQTRAREAEKAAKQAYAEKEHIVKLFFRQASHLFAYKQWFYLLQLENLYFQIKNNKSQSISSLFPVGLPWVPRKTRKMRKNWQKPPASGKKRAERGLPRYEYDISKYAVVFALGLSLVGAGLLLGWTVGWMLPAL